MGGAAWQDLAWLVIIGLMVGAIWGFYHLARRFKKDGKNLKDWG